MNETPRRPARRRSMSSPDLFKRFGCKGVEYEFEVPLEAFSLKAFYKETGISPEAPSWSSILAAKNQSTGYHIHFDGKVDHKEIHLYLRYYGGAIKPRPNEPEPFTESMMPWIGKFFTENSWRAVVNVHFEKSTDKWRGRFNLPFKVTMADTEVTIDGVSLSLPKNPFGAVSGWLSKTEKKLLATALLFRNIEFANFSLERDIVEFNDAIRIYAEEVNL